jgi:signal transduction histidine kinase
VSERSSRAVIADHEWALGLLEEVRGPLLRALREVAPHAGSIRAESRRLLEPLTGPELAGVLADLELEPPNAELDALDFAARAQALEAWGKRLARLGVRQDHAAAAIAFKLESWLPYVLSTDRRPDETIAAVARLGLASGLWLSGGYARARAESRSSFDDSERRRLSRDLHDEVGHQLVTLKLYLEMIDGDVRSGSTSELQEKLREALDLVGQTVQAVRRLILDIGPAVLEELGLESALRLYGRQFSIRTGIEVDVSAVDVPALPQSHQLALYRLFQGALGNVLKHARARRVRASLAALRGTVLVMTVEDDGVGFDTRKARSAFGLAAMRERVEALGGRFHVESRQSGRAHGTRIEVDLPLPKEFP